VRIETILRAMIAAKEQALEASWAQGFTGQGKKKESPKEYAARLDFIARRNKQAGRFRAYMYRKAGWDADTPGR